MSYLFFMDESGHDHKNCPYEVIWRPENHGPWAFFITDLYKQ